MRLTAALVTALALFVPQAVAATVQGTTADTLNTYTARVERVIDADGLRLEGVGPDIRLWGVDGAEWHEEDGTAGELLLDLLTRDKVLSCREVDRDRHARIVARCFLPDGIEVNGFLIEFGPQAEYCLFSRNAYGTCR